MHLAILVGSLAALGGIAIATRRLPENSLSRGYVGIFAQSALALALFVVLMLVYNWHLQASLDAFDLNSDGIFGPDEISEAQGEAMNRLINDAGRNMFLLLSPLVFCGIATLRCLLLLVLRRRALES